MTTITRAQSIKLQQVALFTAANRNRSFSNLLTEESPKSAVADKKGVKQSSYHMPIVRITDLSKKKGDTVDMQIVHKLSKKPTMGDKKLSGRGENLSFSDFDLMVNQGRHLVENAGRMSQQRTVHDIMKTGRTLLGTYWNDLDDQLNTVHLAGARGDFIADDTIVPLESDPEYKEILVNPVLAPTYNRHFFGGDATKLEDLDAADVFGLEVVNNLALYLEEMAHPIQPIRLEKDTLADSDPFYVLNITPRQFNDFRKSTSYKDWQDMTSRVSMRTKGFSHPLFLGDCVMWRGILIRKYTGMPIRFYTGSKVQVSNNDELATVKDVEAKTNIDRAILLGGQALAKAFGVGDTGAHFDIHTEKTDHENASETSIRWVDGRKKIRFMQKDGKVQDNGVIAVDTAVTL